MCFLNVTAVFFPFQSVMWLFIWQTCLKESKINIFIHTMWYFSLMKRVKKSKTFEIIKKTKLIGFDMHPHSDCFTWLFISVCMCVSVYTFHAFLFYWFLCECLAFSSITLKFFMFSCSISRFDYFKCYIFLFCFFF